MNEENTTVNKNTKLIENLQDRVIELEKTLKALIKENKLRK
jgi:hypothetical protein